VVGAADAQVRIPMQPGVDSVNVATAAAIAFYAKYVISRHLAVDELDARVSVTASSNARRGDEEHGAGKRVEGLFELFDCREIEVVGGLVEHEAVDAACRQERERRAGCVRRVKASRDGG